MSGHPILIHDDGTVYWFSVDTGATRVLAINRKKLLITLHIDGRYWWDNGGKHYAEARIEVHEYETTPDPNQITLKELFGVMSWKPRGERWTPKLEKQNGN